MRTLRAEQIKKTKTILRDYMYDNGGVYRRLITAKNAGRQLSRRFFAALLLQTPGEEIAKRRKKMIPPGDR